MITSSLRTTLLVAGLGILTGCATSSSSSSPSADHSTSLGRQDLVSGRPHASMLFYQEAFGWSAARKGAEGYWEVSTTDGQAVGGVISLPKLGNRAGWLTTVDVADLDDVLEKVKENGGAVEHGPVTVYGNIRTAVVTDPQNARLQLRESSTPGTSGPWIWHELVTEDIPATAEWYETVLGFKTQPAEDSERIMLLHEDKPVAAISPNPFEGEPNQWIPVLGVADMDAQLKAVLNHGGQVLTMSDAEGRKIALVADPQNAPFLLQQTEETQP